jgi:hypothetical protein
MVIKYISNIKNLSMIIFERNNHYLIEDWQFILIYLKPFTQGFSNLLFKTNSERVWKEWYEKAKYNDPQPQLFQPLQIVIVFSSGNWKNLLFYFCFSRMSSFASIKFLKVYIHTMEATPSIVASCSFAVHIIHTQHFVAFQF